MILGFRKKKDEGIKAGELFIFKGMDGDPFPPKEQKPVKILDVKDGWVRYEIDSWIFKDERMKLDNFLYCYRKV